MVTDVGWPSSPSTSAFMAVLYLRPS